VHLSHRRFTLTNNLTRQSARKYALDYAYSVFGVRPALQYSIHFVIEFLLEIFTEFFNASHCDKGWKKQVKSCKAVADAAFQAPSLGIWSY